MAPASGLARVPEATPDPPGWHPARATAGPRLVPELRPAGPPGGLPPLSVRALALWPGLDRARLGRTRGDPRKVARLVARRTNLSEDTILEILRRA